MSEPLNKQQNAGEFRDPLECYEPKTYDDPLQQALADETVEAIQSVPYASVPVSTPVAEAVQQLANLHVACILVEDRGKLVGILTDRDVLNNVALEYDQVKTRPVSEVMTMEPVFVYETDTSAAVLSVMAVSGYRHVPVLRADKTIVGIVSPQRVTEFLQRYFDD